MRCIHLNSLLLVLFLTCCSTKNISKKKYDKLLEQTFLLTPDSLLTTDQIALKIKVYDCLYTYITSNNNRQKLPVTRKEVESNGIPDLYYDIIQYQIKENNSYIDMLIKEGAISEENFDCDTLIKESKERYWSTERPLLVSRLTKQK